MAQLKTVEVRLMDIPIFAAVEAASTSFKWLEAIGLHVTRLLSATVREMCGCDEKRGTKGKTDPV